MIKRRVPYRVRGTQWTFKIKKTEHSIFSGMLLSSAVHFSWTTLNNWTAFSRFSPKSLLNLSRIRRTPWRWKRCHSTGNSCLVVYQAMYLWTALYICTWKAIAWRIRSLCCSIECCILLNTAHKVYWHARDYFLCCQKRNKVTKYVNLA